MAIGRYSERISVNDSRPFTRPQIERPVDISSSIDRVADTVLGIVTEKRADEAEKAALKAVGEAEIVKDEAGNYVRPTAPKAGKVYMEAYDKAMDQRYGSLVINDYQKKLDELAVENRFDPETFTANAQGWANGFLKAAPANLRPVLEDRLARELGERARGIADAASRQAYNAAVNGLEAEIKEGYASGNKILELGGEDAERRAGIEYQRAETALDQLVDMGVLDERGRQAALRGGIREAQDAGDVLKSKQFLASFGRQMPKLSDEEMDRLEIFGRGTTDGGTVAGMTFEQFVKSVPDERIRGVMGSIANNAVNERRTAAREAAAEARAAAAEQSSAKILAAIKYKSESGRTQEEVAAINMDFERNADVTTQAGQIYALASLGQYGVLPETARGWAESFALSSDIQPVMGWLSNLQMVRTADGREVGYKEFEKMSPELRTSFAFNDALARAGYDAATRSAYVQEQRRGKLPKLSEAREVYGKDQDYAAKRDKALRDALGIGTIAIPAGVRQDFETLLPLNQQLYPSDATKALTESARQVANGWTKGKVFLGGVGPRDLASYPVTPTQLSDVLLRGKSWNPTGASFEAGTAKLVPIIDSPTEGFGQYWLRLFDRSGRPISSVRVDMDAAMAPTISARQRAGTLANQQALEAGTTAPWVLTTDKNTGKVAYRQRR